MGKYPIVTVPPAQLRGAAEVELLVDEEVETMDEDETEDEDDELEVVVVEV